MTLRLGTFAAICRRLLFCSHVRSKIIRFNRLIHTSVIQFGDPIEIKMPSLSPTMTEGTIVKWVKNEGDKICPGDVICEIQTDKAIVGFEVEEEGILLKILMPENSKNVQLGEIIAVIGSEGSIYEPKPVVKSLESEKIIDSEVNVSHASHQDIPKLLGPSVRKLLEEYNIKFSMVNSSGPQNNILKGDVLSYINKNNLKPQQLEVTPNQITETKKPPLLKVLDESAYIDLPVTSMRKTIARRLTEAKTTIPHAYVSADCCIDKILTLRKSLQQDGIKVSVNDFVIKSVASALCKVPKMNVVKSNGSAVVLESVDISVAVATENGLITPIIKNANYLSVQDISNSVKNLALKAREGKLKLEEFQGGSFTISNLGMFGISEFSAVINPPQGAILAIGTTRLVAENNQPVQKMNVTLSYDCSIIGEQDAGLFLQSLKTILENPSIILL